MTKVAASIVVLSVVAWFPSHAQAVLDVADGADEEACEMQTTLLQTKTEMLVAKRHFVHSQLVSDAPPMLKVNRSEVRDRLLVAVTEAKAKVADRFLINRSDEGHISRQEACAIADETEENTVVASLVPNNGLVCYQGTKRELDRTYCLLGTAPTRALYRAGASPWFQGDDVPADVEVETGSCESRGYDFLMHDPDDCWAPVQKWLNGERREEDMEAWELAQGANWDSYDEHYGVDADGMDTGIFLSGCICLPGTDVMDAMHEICDVVEQEGYLPIA